MDSLSSFAAVAFFWAALLVYVFSLFGLTFLLLHDAKKSGPVDVRLRSILEESIPIPDWQELRTLLLLLTVVFAVVTPVYFALQPKNIIQLRWIYLSNIAVLACGALQIAWLAIFWRLRSQLARRRYFLENLRSLEFPVRLRLKPVNRLQRRLNIREGVIEESNRGISLFFYTRNSNAQGASGGLAPLPGLLKLKAPVFVSDEHLEYLKTLR